jgi:adenylate cyclase
MGHGWTEFPDRALQQAHDLAQQALRLEAFAGAHGLLGAIYLARGQYELANDALQRAIALNPNDAESLSGLGTVMLYLGRTDEAVQAFHMALRFDPGMPADTLFELGLGYYLQTRYDQAIQTLEQGKARNPDNPFIHAALAAAYVRAGRSEEAAQEVVMVRRLHPFFEVAAFGTRFRNAQDRERVAQGLRDAGLQ